MNRRERIVEVSVIVVLFLAWFTVLVLLIACAFDAYDRKAAEGNTSAASATEISNKTTEKTVMANSGGFKAISGGFTVTGTFTPETEKNAAINVTEPTTQAITTAKKTEAKTEATTAPPATEADTEQATEAQTDASGYELRYWEAYEKPENHLTRDNGVVYFNGHRETWYSIHESGQTVTAWEIPGKHIAEDGTIRDADGYVCIASSDHRRHTVIITSVGIGKVYDTGCSHGTIDIYTNWR